MVDLDFYFKFTQYTIIPSITLVWDKIVALKLVSREKTENSLIKNKNRPKRQTTVYKINKKYTDWATWSPPKSISDLIHQGILLHM